MSDDEDAAIKRRYMRWTGELQEAYLDALERCGGLHEARPKALLDMLQPRFPFLTLQNVKNHLQKQRTKEAKAAAGGGRRNSASRRSGDEEEDLDDADPMDSGEGPSSGGGAGPAPPRGAPAIWLSDSWAGPLCDATGVAPSNLIDLAKRALALTVHQLALYRKLLGELEQHEEDHTLLVAALREDPSGQTIVLEAQRVAGTSGGAAFSAGLSAGGGGPGSTLTGTTSGAGGEEVRAVRLRRLLARLLPPNPFSSGPKAEAAMKLAAWMAAVSREGDGASVSAGSHLGGAGDIPLGGRRTAAAPDGPARAASGRQGGAGVEEMEAEGAQPRRRSKRHKPLSELLAEIPLQEPLRAPAAAPAPGVPSMPAQGAPPPPAAEQLQQLLMGTGAGLGGDAGSDPLGGALSLLLQQHLSGEQAQAAQAAMEMDDDSLMLRALDAQMSSLLLQSVSNALLRSAQEGGDMPMDAAPGGGGGAAPIEGAAGGAGGAGVPSGFDAAAALAAAGQLQLPAHFQDAVAAALGDDPLSTAAVDISVLRSFLDMLSSGGISPLPSGRMQGGSGGSGPVGAAPAADAAAAPAVHDPAHVPPLSVAAAGGGGSGSGGSGHMGGAFSAFKPTGSGSGGSGAAAAGGGLGSGGAQPDA